jgi:hypothetical protein
VEDGGCEGAIAAEVAAKILILGSLILGLEITGTVRAAVGRLVIQ